VKVLVCVDGSDSSFSAVARAIELAKNSAKVTALHVYPPRLDRDVVSHFEIEPEDLDMKFAREVLDRVAEQFRSQGLEAELRYTEGPVAEVICQEAESGGFDLILLGSRNNPLNSHFVLGEIVRRKSRVPVEVCSSPSTAA
jgi:nucleotide-binding universal stress UspA family protein